MRDEEWSDDEQFDDDPDDAESETVACPVCRRSVYEDAEKCPHCGEWITPASTAEHRSRTWRWPVLIALLIVMILVAWVGLRR